MFYRYLILKYVLSLFDFKIYFAVCFVVAKAKFKYLNIYIPEYTPGTLRRQKIFYASGPASSPGPIEKFKYISLLICLVTGFIHNLFTIFFL